MNIKHQFRVFLALIPLAATCDPSTLPSTVDGLSHPGQAPVAFLYAEGIRIFDCSTGTPSGISAGFVNVVDGGTLPTTTSSANWTGAGYYPDANGNGTFVLKDVRAPSSKQTPIPSTSFNITFDFSSVLFLDSPTGQLGWGRWNVFTAPDPALAQELKIGWGSRVDTEGGAVPPDCTEASLEKEVTVPYTGYYYFYSCPGGTPAAAPASAPPSDAASVQMMKTTLFALFSGLAAALLLG